MGSDEILPDCPDLKAEDLLAALEYGALARTAVRLSWCIEAASA
jgi:hypothetical protein